MSRIAIMSDVHANAEALRDALADAAVNGCDRRVLLGDIVGYGPDPQECVEIVRENFKDDEIVLGNHDYAIAGLCSFDGWSFHAAMCATIHRDRIRNDDKLWLESLKKNLRWHYARTDDPIMVVGAHGSFTDADKFNYVNTIHAFAHEFGVMKGMYGSHDARGKRVGIEFVGHTHAPCAVRCVDLETYSFDREKRDKFSVDCTRPYVVNVGSVGYPRSADKPCYVIYDSDAKTVEFRWLPFDAELYEQRLETAGMPVPHWLHNRIINQLKGS